MPLLQLCLDHADLSRAALLCGQSGRSLSYAQLADEVAGLAESMLAAGVRPGMRLSIAMPASIEFVVALLASMKIGAAPAPLDLSLKGDSLARSMASLQPHALLVSSRVGDRFASVGTLLGLCLRVEAATGECQVIRRAPAASEPDPAGLEDGDALLISTSGTTGWPKYVRLGAQGTAFNVRAHLQSFDFQAPMRNLQVLGVNYSYGCVASLLGTLANGGTVIFPERLDGEGIANALREHRPDTLYVSPALADYLIDAAGNDARHWFGSVTRLGIGGDNCPPPLRAKIARALPAAAPYITFGVTEAGPRVATLAPQEFLSQPRSVGHPIPGVRVAVLDEEGRLCAPDQVGRLEMTTPSAMRGYLGQPLLDTLVVVSGDLASLDAEGRLSLHGRMDRQIKLRGNRIHPHQIETLLMQLPGVRRCEVRLDQTIDRLVADVFYDAAEILDPSRLQQALQRHCRMHLPNRQVPAQFRVQSVTGYFFKGRHVAALNHN